MNRDNEKKSGGKHLLLICLIITALAAASIGLCVRSDKTDNPIEAFMLFIRGSLGLDPDESGDGTDSGKGTEPDSPTESETDAPSGTTTDEKSDVPPETEPSGTTEPEQPLDPVEYYKDTLFIGDFRTAGLYTYGRIDGASYFARSQMTVSNCFDSAKSETGTGSLSLEEYLKNKRFGKIYVLLGINEIGYSYDWIVTRYEKMIARLRELQPDAVIVIQSNMHVTKAKSDANPNSYNNTRIDSLNSRLSGLADGKKVFYLSFEAIFDGDDGALNPDYSANGIQLKPKSFMIWHDFLIGKGMLRLPENTGDTGTTAPDTSVPDGTTVPVTNPPTTEPPTTEPPATKPPVTDPPTTEPEQTDPPVAEPKDTDPPVTDPDIGDFFDDALFIGDSRTVGLFRHGKISGAEFFAKDDATVFTFKNGFDTEKPDPEFGDKTLSEVLSSRKFGKIYLLFGINDLGGSTPTSIYKEFTKFISLISNAQPDAKIIIQSNMHVTKAVSDANPDSYSNTRIDSLNRVLAGLANGKRVFYFGFEQLFDGDDGCLKAEYAGSDGMGLAGDKPYIIWRNYIAGRNI